MTYCRGALQTFDSISVRFRKEDFDHCFFESSRRNRIKDRFSQARATRIDWIKATLKDNGAELYVGWDGKKKRYDTHRRVAIVVKNYVLVIHITGEGKANFVTAYVADTIGTPERPITTLDQIRRSPKWE